MPGVIVFLGPSLDTARAKEILDADYRPPAERGSIPNAVADGAEIIALIDGVFFESCSVGHREVLDALKRGVKVYGASSMGALRACELEPFGMTGVGEVFRLFRDGEIESDDEVALVCDPVIHAPCSEALVDIRMNLGSALEERVISREDHDMLLKTAISMYYPERTYPGLIRKARMDYPGRDFSAFGDWIRDHRFSQKERDAMELLELIRDRIS